MKRRHVNVSEVQAAAKPPDQQVIPLAPENTLFDKVVAILDAARGRVVQAVNHEMVTAYWLIGREIVNECQQGDARAEYGQRIITSLARRLADRYGAGFSTANLKNFRQFYLAFPDRSPQIGYPVGSQSADGFHPSLSWSHYRALMRVEKQSTRDFYETEAIRCGWTKRELERQINTFFYERLLASQDKTGMLDQARSKAGGPALVEVLKDPYVLEFLNLPDVPQLHETHLEQSIIDNLQRFLLELGKGFSFVARQKRMRFGDKDFYVDLVFYNFLLKCFVLIDLKIGELTHQDIGQMDGYVRMYEEYGKVEGDNPTIGLILCSEKNEAIAKYSVLHENKQLFASKYMLYLPTEDELRREIERERALLETRDEREGRST